MSGNQSSRSPLAASFLRSRKPAIAIIAFGVVVVGAFMVLDRGRPPAPHSTPLAQPRLGYSAGGTDHSQVMDTTVQAQESASAANAAKTGTSYASMITSQSSLPNDSPPEIGDTPRGSTTKATTKSVSTKPACGASPQDGGCFAVDPQKQTSTSSPPQTPPADDSSDTGLSTAVEAELLQNWTPGPPVVDVQLSKDSGGNGSSNTPGNAFATAPQEVMAQAASPAPASPATASNATTQSGSGQTHQLLLAAGRGVYGHAVLEANSDIGGPVLVEIDSGPLAHDRVSGSFQRHDDRLVITFDKLMIGNDDPISVSAYAVSPDTGETGVASEVNEHYLTRIVLPAAAAFVQGLGTAIQGGNTTTVSNGLSTNAYSNLSLAQEAGVGAGAAAQQLGQILQKATPQDPTVILKRNDPVGVVFAQPVYAP